MDLRFVLVRIAGKPPSPMSRSPNPLFRDKFVVRMTLGLPQVLFKLIRHINHTVQMLVRMISSYISVQGREHEAVT
jgi:hypothetical protein